MFRASDIHGAPAGPKGPAMVVGKAAAVVPPPWASGGKGWSGKGGDLGGVGGCPGKSAAVTPPWASGAKGWSKGDMIPSPDVAPALPLNPVVPGGYGPAKAAQPQIPQPSVFAAPYGKGGVAKTRPVTAGKAFVPLPVSRQQATPNTVMLLGAGSLPAGIEKDIEEQARQLCIQHSFSTPEEVRYVSQSLVFIDFPYQEACREFLRVSNGQLKVRQWVYRLQHSSAGEAEQEATLTEGVEEIPSDTLMVRLIGELDEARIKKAFQSHVPVVKGVRMMLDRSTRKSKGFCFVNFYSVSDAMTAKNRMLAAGSIIDSRKVAISFAKPQTQEQALESDMNARAEQDVIQAQANQALSGVNAEMWSSYMQFCQEEKEKESREKQALLEALEAKKRALALQARTAASMESEADGLLP
ncbi:NCL [Symbiodinium natans]|uniref:NCL protein n=1 Tax=Symbiodinium natans TaxID=878477 RepID=A0A812MWX6_9DINO|nr:NCL [Symbiodinium natans]